MAQVLQSHRDEVWYLQFSNNGKHLASSSNDKTAIIWEVIQLCDCLWKCLTVLLFGGLVGD